MQKVYDADSVINTPGTGGVIISGTRHSAKGICVAPPAQAGLAVDVNLRVSGEYSQELSTGEIKAAQAAKGELERSITQNIAVLHDQNEQTLFVQHALYRVCEANLNGILSGVPLWLVEQRKHDERVRVANHESSRHLAEISEVKALDSACAIAISNLHQVILGAPMLGATCMTPSTLAANAASWISTASKTSRKGATKAKGTKTAKAAASATTSSATTSALKLATDAAGMFDAANIALTATSSSATSAWNNAACTNTYSAGSMCTSSTPKSVTDLQTSFSNAILACQTQYDTALSSCAGSKDPVECRNSAVKNYAQCGEIVERLHTTDQYVDALRAVYDTAVKLSDADVRREVARSRAAVESAKAEKAKAELDKKKLDEASKKDKETLDGIREAAIQSAVRGISTTPTVVCGVAGAAPCPPPSTVVCGVAGAATCPPAAKPAPADQAVKKE